MERVRVLHWWDSDVKNMLLSNLFKRFSTFHFIKLLCNLNFGLHRFWVKSTNFYELELH